MNIKFEKGREHDMDVIEDAVKPKEVAKDKNATPVAPRIERNKTQRKGRRVVKRRERVRSEFDQKIISIRRVTRVVAG